MDGTFCFIKDYISIILLGKDVKRKNKVIFSLFKIWEIS